MITQRNLHLTRLAASRAADLFTKPAFVQSTKRRLSRMAATHAQSINLPTNQVVPQQLRASNNQTVSPTIDRPEDEIHMPTLKNAHVSSIEQYRSMYQQSINQPDQFWSDQATQLLDWSKPFTRVVSGSLAQGNVKWFEDGELNACFNCVDRHVLNGKGGKVAILWEADEPGVVRQVTYNMLLDQVSIFANTLKSMGVKKGSAVCIYMPNVPEAAVAMLACARLGAVHSVVFGGFSKDALRDRIVDGECSIVITADGGLRGGKATPLKTIVDDALQDRQAASIVKKVIVYKNTGESVPMAEGRDIWWSQAQAGQSNICPPVAIKATDPLFMLYTSGSTGKPKGIVHAVGGYITYAASTMKYLFDIHEDDRHACLAGVGWITGHTYIVYGPLALGTTTFMFDGIPTGPTPSRYWEMIERHRLTTFYTSPTAVRSLMKYSNSHVKKSDRSSLRVIGSVGEVINPEAWRWLHHEVGNKTTPIVDTYWQTESGGCLLAPLPGAVATKPGSATLPFFGVDPVLLNDKGEVLTGNNVTGLLAIARPWPGLAQTIKGDHERFVSTYLASYPGYYLTGDSCHRDKDGYFWINGRVDDVINISGHRIGSAEVESALITDHRVSESAVIGIPHPVKGSALFCYVIGKEGVFHSQELVNELKQAVRANIGPFATPDHILITQDLPKTRSGKIMRRLLRKIAVGDTDIGDTSTLNDPSVVEKLMDQVRQLKETNASSIKPSANNVGIPLLDQAQKVMRSKL